VIRTVVSGICGRMGSMVAKAVSETPELSLVAGIERPGHGGVGMRLCDYWGEGAIEVPVGDSLDAIRADGYDVVVDFSSPDQAAACADKAARDQRALVVGTTGLGETHLAVIRRCSRACPIVVAPNTSVGVNVLFCLAREAADALGEEFDIEIVEAHHRGKMDAPSGTAVRLLEILARARGTCPDDVRRAGRVGPDTARRKGEIGVHSLRAGSIVGRHSLHFVGDLEELTISHAALSREAFVRGALRAVRFLHGRGPGLYDMTDVLGLARPRD
jgi:4-hydroxy-tetrahydrodipicolinate reductase